MDPEHYLRLAQARAELVRLDRPLVGGGGGQAECRTAISRAYYAAFQESHRFLDGIGVRVDGGPEAHALVQQTLQRSGDASLAGVGTTLSTLAAYRRKADYEPTDRDAGRHRQVDAVIGLAKGLFHSLSTLQADPAYAAISRSVAATILAWAAAAGKQHAVRIASSPPTRR